MPITTLKEVTGGSLQRGNGWSMPEGWQMWQFSGVVIFDQVIDPPSDARLKTYERQLTIRNNELGEQVVTILPHYNASVAEFVLGDHVVLLCHTQKGTVPPSERLTPNYDDDFGTGDWSYILNLDTQAGWPVGRGLSRNRRFAWLQDKQFERLAAQEASSLLDYASVYTSYLKKLGRRLFSANPGSRDLLDEGYFDIRILYLQAMSSFTFQDEQARSDPKRNHRATHTGVKFNNYF